MTGNSTIEIKGLSEFEAKVRLLRTDSPGFEKRLRVAIRKILGHARANLRKEAAEGLHMESDPRHAYKAVRFAVYRHLFGGQVNILQSRRAGAETSYTPPRTLDPLKRGGNRRVRTSRDLGKYEGVDRGFILRWLNGGMTKTNPRTIKFNPNPSRKVDIHNAHPNTGNRGAIAARNWFGPASIKELQAAAGELQQIIDKVIREEFL
jgi:hypothetical protein